MASHNFELKSEQIAVCILYVRFIWDLISVTRAEQLNGEYVVHFHLGSFDILTSAGEGQRNMNIEMIYHLIVIKQSYLVGVFGM